MLAKHPERHDMWTMRVQFEDGEWETFYRIEEEWFVAVTTTVPAFEAVPEEHQTEWLEREFSKRVETGPTETQLHEQDQWELE